MGNDAFRSLQSLLCCNDLAKETPKHDMPDVTWYPETEFCYMKNKNGMFVAAKGGSITKVIIIMMWERFPYM